MIGGPHGRSGPAGSEPSAVDLRTAPPDQRREPWGVIVTRPDPGSGAEPRLEARVEMFADRSRFFVSHSSGKEETLSPAQFVALIMELKRSGRFAFRRHRAAGP